MSYKAKDSNYQCNSAMKNSGKRQLFVLRQTYTCAWTNIDFIWLLRYKFKWNFRQNTKGFFHGNAFENFVRKMLVICSGVQLITVMYNTASVVWAAVFGWHMMASSNGNIFRVTGPLCRELTGPGEFPTQKPVTRSFDVFFDLCLNERLSKQSWGWWFETPSRPLWRHRNE